MPSITVCTCPPVGRGNWASLWTTFYFSPIMPFKETYQRLRYVPVEHTSQLVAMHSLYHILCTVASSWD